MTEVNREYKDRVFKFIFGNPENKEWTLSLYNAVNGSQYKNPDEIQFNTIEDAVYMGMKNDVSFIIRSEMNLWEHQSSFNPNMPMRFLTYGTQLYEKYIASSEYYLYSRSLQALPKPADIEVKVTMLNINYGKNRALMEACQPLREYAWLVDKVRYYQKALRNFEAAVEAAIQEMPEEFEIRNFLIANRAEVRRMLLTEYDEEKVLAQERKETEIRTENRINERVATDMIRDGESLAKIKKYSKLPEAAIRKLAESMGVAVL